MKKALLWLLAIPAICCILLLSGCASVKITKPAVEIPKVYATTEN